MRQMLLAALAVSFAAAAAAADFEGVIDSRMTVQGKTPEESGGGTARLYVSGQGSRMETAMTTGMGSMKMTVLHLKARPGVGFLLNDEKKIYSEMQAPGERPEKEEPEEKLTVRKLPNERVAGYDCAHALLVDARGEKTEIWATKALGGAEAFWAAQAGEERAGGRRSRALPKALRDAGLDGWPLKLRSFPEAGQEVVWEATKVERKPVPSSLLSLSGYRKAEGGMGAMGQMQLSPEQQKKMSEAMKQQREAMKKMSPEQRQQMEEVMRSLQGDGDGK
jgi:hypothetical protein